MSERFAQMFAALRQRQEAAFVPFVTLCDPDPHCSYDILTTLVEAGADALELGIPFSDPCADGPVIQKANKRALAAGSSTNRCLALIVRLRRQYPQLPISLLVYANLVKARGLERFYRDAHVSGVDAVLVPDVPLALIDHPGADFQQAAQESGICPVLIAPPNATAQHLAKIAALTKGYTYVVSRLGITGDAQRAGVPGQVIAALRSYRAPPCLLGFGIADTQDVHHALNEGHADGVIAGSRVVRIIEEHLNDRRQMLTAVAAYVTAMKDATRGFSPI